MNSSPSSHQLESLNQEDEAASTAGEGVEASPPTSLLDLPDELLLTIFERVYRLSLPHPDDDSLRTGSLLPPSTLMVNKRIFEIASPLRPRYLSTPRDPVKLDRFFPDILSRPHILSLVEHLSTELHMPLPALPSFSLSLFTSLTSLTICFRDTVSDPANYWDAVPRQVTDMLKKLRHLHALKLTGFAPDLEDTSFSLDKDIPSLRVLDVESDDVLRTFLVSGSTRLESLTTRTSGLAILAIPWHTLRRVRLVPEGVQVDEPDDLVQAVQSAAGEGIVTVEHLDLDFYIFNGRYSDSWDFERVQIILGALAPFERLKSVAFGLDDRFVWPQTSLQVSSAEALTLRGPLILSQEHTTPLCALVSSFPNLCTLNLDDLLRTCDPLVELFSAKQRLGPVWESLLEALKERTGVRRVRCRVEREKREVRWTRVMEEDAFDAEVWHL
ncbi:hypothetical protein JCM6882_000107 [Rhodosporidiobolus microsporus]